MDIDHGSKSDFCISAHICLWHNLYTGLQKNIRFDHCTGMSQCRAAKSVFGQRLKTFNSGFYITDPPNAIGLPDEFLFGTVRAIKLESPSTGIPKMSIPGARLSSMIP